MEAYSSIEKSTAAIPVLKPLPWPERDTIIKRLLYLRDRTLSDVKQEKKEALSVKVSFRQPPHSVTRPDLFDRFAKTFTIEGRQDFGRFIFFNGLTTPGYSWFDFAAKLYDRAGVYTEVHPLKGQNGNWYDFRSTTFKMWVKDILDVAAASPEAPVMFAFSTSVPALLEAWRKNPGFCRAIVAIGAPLFLNNVENEKLMERVRKIAFPFVHINGINILKYASTKFLRRDNRFTHRCPQFVRLPISTAVELRKAQIAGLRALSDHVMPPIFYGQGSNDAAVSRMTWKLFKSRLVRSPFKVVAPLYQNADHSVQTGNSLKFALRDICNFLEAMYLREGHNPAQLPEFQKSTSQMRLAKELGQVFFA